MTLSTRSDAPVDRGVRRRPTVPLPFVLVAVTAALLGAAVFLRVQADDRTMSGDADDGPYAGTELPEPQPRPAFTLTDTEGRPFDFRAETGGRLTLLFFGYTSCPDICPLHLANLAFALDHPGVPRPVVVFVGVDRQRDTPEAIRTFLDRFDSRFIGLTGTEEQLRVAQEAAGVPAAIMEEPEPGSDDYLVGHASQVLAYTAQDTSPVVYPFGVRQEDWIADLPLLARIGPEGS